MAFYLDNIDLKTYGVGVIKSTGLLDMPRMVDQSTDWLDVDGRDYWQNAADVKYQEREIQLQCWIKGDDYDDFRAKVAAFYAAITAPGQRVLKYDASVIANVSVQQRVEMVRKTHYVDSLQIGMFTLRLTVSGDSQTKLLTVYNSAGLVRAVVKYGSDAKLNRQLQADSSVTFQFESSSPADLGRGDYIIVNGEKYISLEYPEKQTIADNKHVYPLTYKHQFFVTDDVPFLVIDNPETPWYANMSEIIDMLITCLNEAYPGLFVKGTIDNTERKNHTFSNESCLDVIIRISGDYELEYQYVQDQVTGVITLNIQKQIGSSTGLIFERGINNVNYKIKRVPTPRVKLCTKLRAYGSSKNIPAVYGFPRLRIDPIERPFFDMKIWRTKKYEEIFPEHTGVVSGYLKKQKAATWVYAPGTEGSAKPIKIYTFYPDDNTYELNDSTMFDLNELDENGNTKYWIVGTNPKINFTSGDLAGLPFEVTDFNNDTKTFIILPYKDEAGNVYPSASLYPRPGDTYKILDIIPPEASISAAETRLYNAAWADMYTNGTFNPEQADYVVETNPAFNLSTLNPGDSATVIEADYGLNTELRIKDINSNLYTGGSTITLSPNSVRPNLQNLKLKVATLEGAVKAANITDVNQRRGNDQTTSELKNALIDPIDEKLNADKIIRRKTIDPVHLSEDAKTLNYSLKGALVSVNMDGDPNKMTIEAGQFFNHSFYAVDRKTIKVIKEIEP